jgi:DNA-binding beta-propeller fold protein YncE
MPELETLFDGADRIPAPDLWPDIEGRPPRGIRTGPGLARRLAVAGLALATAAAGVVVASRAFLARPDRPGETATDPVPLDLNPRVTAEIPVGQFPSEIAVGEGGVWVTVNEADQPPQWFVARVDPATNSVTDQIEVYEVADVAVGAGAVWAIGTDRGTGAAAFRIDPSQREVVATIPLDCGRCFPTQVVATDAALWVTASSDYPDSGEILRVDPATNEVSAQLSVPGDPRDLVVGEGAVWVYSLTHFGGGAVAGGSIYRIDPETATLTATLLPGEVPPASGVDTPPVLAVGHGFLWTSKHRSGNFTFGSTHIDVVRIDPQTNEVVGEPIPLVGLFLPVAVDDAGVWYRGEAPTNRPLISRLNAETLQVDESLRIDTLAIDGSIDTDAHTIWLANYRRSVTRIDLR